MSRLRTADWLLPALVCALGLVELASLAGLDGRGVAAAVLVASCALLVGRRRWPLVCCTAAALLQAGLPFAGPAYDEAATGLLVVAVAIFALGRWIADLRGAIGLVATWLVLLAGYSLVDLRDKGLDDVVFVLAVTAPPYVFGRIARRLADYNTLLQREQDLERRAAVRDERDRIARELHDVIAHSLSAMVVQVAAAEELLRRDPERAAAVLGRVADTGRRAISETGDLLHVLRDTDDELGLAPTPGLRDLDELITTFERDGLVVDLVVDGLPEEVPPAVDTSAYRIVREALTNALRYAADRTVRVEVSATTGGLTVRAVNASSGGTGLGAGLGLAGLRERVDLLGGSLRHGPADDGRYELVAVLPLERELV
jgi:signal transduction histidine kinase